MGRSSQSKKWREFKNKISILGFSLRVCTSLDNVLAEGRTGRAPSCPTPTRKSWSRDSLLQWCPLLREKSSVGTSTDCWSSGVSHDWPASAWVCSQDILNHGTRTQCSSLSVQCFIFESRRQKPEVCAQEVPWTNLYRTVQNASVVLAPAGAAGYPVPTIMAGSMPPFALPGVFDGTTLLDRYVGMIIW